jgi:hypothetical protein
MSEHSPGPWRSGRQDMVSYTELPGEDGGPWKFVYGNAVGEMHMGKPLPVPVARAYGTTEDEALANARLIAAAPALLKALRELVEAADSEEGYGDNFVLVLDGARDALKGLP